MKTTALAFALAGTLGIATVAAPATAEARGFRWGPAIGGLAAGAAIAGLASSAAYGWGPGYYGGYAPAYYGGGYGPYYGGYAPAYDGYGYYGGGPYTTVSIGFGPGYDGYRHYGYRRAFRPAYAYWGGPRFYGPRWHHRWHHRGHRW